MTKYEAKEPVGSLRSRGEIIRNIYDRNTFDAQRLQDKHKWKKCKVASNLFKRFMAQALLSYQLLLDENLSNFISFTETVLVMMKVMSS